MSRYLSGMWVEYVDIGKRGGNEMVRKSVGTIDKHDFLFICGSDMVNRIVCKWKDFCTATNRLMPYLMYDQFAVLFVFLPYY